MNRTDRASRDRRGIRGGLIRRIGVVGFAFFALKGLAWLAAGAVLWWF